MDLIFKTKHITDFVNSCYRRGPRLETFPICNSDHVPAKAAVGAEDFVPGVCAGEAHDRRRAINSCVLNHLF